jgi:Plasmid pRiA4b ORF-3-like protein
MTAARIARLRIKLDDVEPAVVRRVEVPLTIRLDRLHLVLQAAMGWTNSDLYEIRARDVGWGRPDPHFGDGPARPASSTCWKMSAPGRSNTSTTLAMAGSIPSASNV